MNKSIITKEHELRAFITGFLTDPAHDEHSENSMTAQVFRIALAAMDAEPVADVVAWHKEGEERTCDIRWRRFDVAPGPLFAVAQPVSVNDDMAYAFHHAISDSSLGSDEVEEIKAGLRAAFANVTATPSPVSVPECFKSLLHHAYGMTMGHDWNKGTMAGHHRAKLCQAVDECRASMFQGAEPVTTAYKSPFEQWLSQQTGTIDVECGCVMTEVFFHWLRVAYEAGNSPVIPDGWALVPVEPTEDMIVNGFESEPDESFSDEKEWEAYDAMSGCQQAAHRAKLCWAAMISAAPKPDAR